MYGRGGKHWIARCRRVVIGRRAPLDIRPLMTVNEQYERLKILLGDQTTEINFCTLSLTNIAVGDRCDGW